MNETEIENAIKAVSEMSHLEMARMRRFCQADHPYFDRTLPIYAVFEKRFNELGAFNPAISKAIER